MAIPSTSPPTSHAAPAGRRRPLARRLLVLAASAAVALVACELVLRASSPRLGGYYVRQPGLRTTFHPAPGLMPGVAGPSRFEIGSLGVRGDELDGGARFRVLAVGGSTTECLYLDQTEAWPQRLQERLRAARPDLGPWVGNAGVSGRNARDLVVQLPRLLPRVPELDVVLVLVGVNELMLRLSQDDAYDPAFLERADAEERLLPRAFEVLPLEHAPGPPWKRSALWRLAADARRALAREAVQDEAGAAYALWRRHRREAPRILDELPDLGPALQEHRRNLTALIAACRVTGAEPIVLTHPCLWRAGLSDEARSLLWMGWVGDSQATPGQPYYAAEALRRGLERYNAVAREVAAEEGVAVIELAEPLSGELAWFYDDVHLNEAGAARAAELVAERLLERAPFR